LCPQGAWDQVSGRHPAARGHHPGYGTTASRLNVYYPQAHVSGIGACRCFPSTRPSDVAERNIASRH
ncbi:hypothetical protein LZ30DRAFT_742592, partial [Colletotrichum cereale]